VTFEGGYDVGVLTVTKTFPTPVAPVVVAPAFTG
jgi:hypothetical protein